MTYADGSSYDGQWTKGRRHGQGAFQLVFNNRGTLLILGTVGKTLLRGLKCIPNTMT